MDTPVDTGLLAEAEQAIGVESAVRPPWSDSTLEQLAAEEDRRLAETRARQAEGLDPYESLITVQDLRARAAGLRSSQDTAV